MAIGSACMLPLDVVGRWTQEGSDNYITVNQHAINSVAGSVRRVLTCMGENGRGQYLVKKLQYSQSSRSPGAFRCFLFSLSAGQLTIEWQGPWTAKTIHVPDMGKVCDEAKVSTTVYQK
ncbi:uncharacterized protein LOC135482758 isoform X2 [Lineus longissimus]|uniref:uncharacterized protein LOC135482758 isoform X2 n=1 Tax=Lineus longissimus TaxID=88925 RepID=UPI00315C8AF8